MASLRVFYLPATNMKIGLILWYLAVVVTFVRAIGGVQEICEGESFEMRCGESEVIVMQTALYGRMRSNNCITKNLHERNCSLDVMHIMDAKCSGRRQCDVRVSALYDDIAADENPCGRELRSYLAARATCITVNMPGYECSGSRNPPTLTAPYGYLSSIVTKETKCGTYQHPWRVIADAGQTIKLSMFDFMAGTRDPNDFIGGVPNTCDVYAVVREGQQTDTICGRHRKENVVFTSNKNELEIRIAAPEQNQLFFVMKYEAIGCKQLSPPAYGWVKQTNTRATMGCNFTDVIWDLQCTENTWTVNGENKTCTATTFYAGASRTSESSGASFIAHSQWFVILMITTIAVTLGFLIFITGLVYLRRKKLLSAQPSPERMYQPAEVTPYYSARVADNMLIPDYSAQAERNKVLIATQEGTFLGQYPPNNYSRTWTMHRHKASDSIGPLSNHDLIAFSRQNTNEDSTNQNIPRHMGNCQSATNQISPGLQQISEIDGRPILEHIYESPKFQRKCNSLDNPRNKQSSQSTAKTAIIMDRNIINAGNVQYYELDPHSVNKRQRNDAALQ